MKGLFALCWGAMWYPLKFISKFVYDARCIKLFDQTSRIKLVNQLSGVYGCNLTHSLISLHGF
jgi:hypothetical protein